MLSSPPGLSAQDQGAAGTPLDPISVPRGEWRLEPADSGIWGGLSQPWGLDVMDGRPQGPCGASTLQGVSVQVGPSGETEDGCPQQLQRCRATLETAGRPLKELNPEWPHDVAPRSWVCLKEMRSLSQRETTPCSLQHH